MARGTQFGVLKTMLRNEVSRSNTAGSAGVADFNELGQILNRHYETLYAGYDWPHRRVVFDRITLNAGSRYYDFPSSCDYERIEEIVVWVNGQPLPIDRGIELKDYAAFSSEDDARADPVLKWDVRFTGTREQMEVWPLPAGNDQKIQIQGIQKFAKLVADGDTCKLDDNLVVAFAAAEIAARQESSDASAKLSAAQQLYNRLRGRSKGASKTYVFGQGPDERNTWPPKNPIVVTS